MIAVILVRDGVLPAGSDEAICEAERRVLLVGSSVARTLDDVSLLADRIWTVEFDPARASITEIASLVAESLRHIHASDPTGAPSTRLAETVVLPASPDGRDLAPHLALALDSSLHAGAMSIGRDRVTVARRGGLYLADIRPDAPFVATLQIGVRGADVRGDVESPPDVVDLTSVLKPVAPVGARSVEQIDVQPPDASTMDLAEADRILGGGAGLSEAAAFERLQRVSARLGASMGVTRVITDRGWAEHTRQIGTTGVVVDPKLYVSFGISGAVQHTSGLGHPDHIISVNTDAHCPMMQISDVAIVADADAVLEALENLLRAAEADQS